MGNVRRAGRVDEYTRLVVEHNGLVKEINSHQQECDQQYLTYKDWR